MPEFDTRNVPALTESQFNWLSPLPRAIRRAATEGLCLRICPLVPACVFGVSCILIPLTPL